VNFRKIKWAERILLTKDLSISEVGERIGMPNMAHFYKMFRKYNECSPKEFQKKMLAWGKG
jgi:YesN/AraC family two-component response regulator